MNIIMSTQFEVSQRLQRIKKDICLLSGSKEQTNTSH